MPIELINFYQILLENLNNKLMEIEEQVKAENLDENVSEVFLGEGDFSSTSYIEKKTQMSRKYLFKTRSTVESSKIFNSESEPLKESSIQSILQNKTTLEIEEMLYCT